MSETTDNSEDLPNIALKKIQALANGNGIKANEIALKDVQGSIIQCQAITHIELCPEIKSKTEKGKKTVGKLVESPEQIQNDIDDLTEGLIKNEDSRKKIAKILTDRPDKGYSLHAEYFALDALNTDFSLHEACQQCAGHSNTACNRCNGQRQELCTQCHGKSMIPCNFCRSTGFTQGPQGDPVKCSHCHGERQMACPLCRRTGHIPCRQCRGSGQMSCAGCGGAGWFTHVTTFMIKIKTLFEIDREALPDPAVKLIENSGSKLVEKGHIKLKATPVRREDDGLAIQYDTAFPYGEIDITLKGKPIRFQFFGYKCKLIKVPPFLDNFIAPGLKNLKKAADGQGSTTDLIKKASQYRVIKKGVALSLSASNKKAMMGLKRAFPMGISDKILQQIIIMANKSFAHATRKPRYTGLAIGLVVTTILYAAYFLGPLRETIGTSLGNDMMKMVTDLALIPTGGFLISMIIKIVAKKSMQSIIQNVMPQGRSIVKVKAHSSGWWGYAGAAILFLLIVEITRHTGTTTPDWYFLK